MQFSVLSVLTLLAAGLANAAVFDAFPNKRQSTQPKADSPAMTDKDGNIVAFDATGVYQANKANGL